MQVPDDPEELLELLAAEAAPLSTWVDCAKAYLAVGKEDAFTHICLEGVKVTTDSLGGACCGWRGGRAD